MRIDHSLHLAPRLVGATIMMISLTPAVPSTTGCVYYRQPHEDMDLPLPIIVTALTHQAEDTDVVAASKAESGSGSGARDGLGWAEIATDTDTETDTKTETKTKTGTKTYLQEVFCDTQSSPPITSSSSSPTIRSRLPAAHCPTFSTIMGGVPIIKMRKLQYSSPRTHIINQVKKRLRS